MDSPKAEHVGSARGMTPSLTVVFAVTAALAVGNLYWAQPLLAQIAQGFSTDPAQAGMLVTATQIGYAVGILLIVPLGDVLNRRKLLFGVMAASAVALAASAFAPAFLALAIALCLVGLTTVSGQIVIPLAGDLARDAERGRIVGMVSAGMTLGILVARSVSGIVAEALGWRAIYVIAAVLNVALAIVIWRTVPNLPAKESVRYPALIADVFRSLATTPTLLRVMAISGLAFGLVFNVFWTSLTFLLSAEPFGFSTLQIGLVSLAGVAGSLASLRLGGLADGPHRIAALGAFLALGFVCMAAAVFAGGSLVAIVAVAAVFSVAVQGVTVLNQARLFTLAPEKRSRLNTCFVVGNFLFGAVGSSLSGILWSAGGWQACMAGALGASALAIIVWAASRTAFRRFDDTLVVRAGGAKADSPATAQEGEPTVGIGGTPAMARHAG